jgi:hypothetical protein
MLKAMGYRLKFYWAAGNGWTLALDNFQYLAIVTENHLNALRRALHKALDVVRYEK